MGLDAFGVTHPHLGPLPEGEDTIGLSIED